MLIANCYFANESCDHSNSVKSVPVAVWGCGKIKVVSEQEYARVSEFKTMLEFKNVLTRV